MQFKDTDATRNIQMQFFVQQSERFNAVINHHHLITDRRPFRISASVASSVVVGVVVIHDDDNNADV